MWNVAADASLLVKFKIIIQWQDRKYHEKAHPLI